jgi:hypothetical protein
MTSPTFPTDLPVFRELPTPTDRERATEYANRILDAEYRDAVASIAHDVRDAIERGEVTSPESATEYMEQSVDGSYWVIYTHAALQVLRYSEFSGEAAANGVDVVDGDLNINWSVLAYHALLADVRELVDIDGTLSLLDGSNLDGSDADESDDAEEYEMECPSCGRRSLTTVGSPFDCSCGYSDDE